MTQSLEQRFQSVSDVLNPEDSCELHTRSTDADTPLHLVVWCSNYDRTRLHFQVILDVNAARDTGVCSGYPHNIVLLTEAESFTDLLISVIKCPLLARRRH